MNDMTRIITLALALAFPAALSAQTTARLSLDWQSLSDMVTRQMAIEPGERVLLVAHPDMFQDLIGPLRRAVAVAGGIDLGVIDVLAGPAPPAPTMDASRAALRQMFRAVDIAVMLPGATTAHAPYLAIQDLLREGHGRAIHFHWFDDGSISPVLGQPVPPFVVVDAVYQRAVIETDYAALAARQVRFADAMRDAEIRVTTRAGTDLRFRIGDRPVKSSYPLARYASPPSRSRSTAPSSSWFRSGASDRSTTSASVSKTVGSSMSRPSPDGSLSSAK